MSEAGTRLGFRARDTVQQFSPAKTVSIVYLSELHPFDCYQTLGNSSEL